jgi:hypothetical protein
MMLNEQSIPQALRDLVDHLSNGNLNQAKETLEELEFERLLKRNADPSKGPSRSIDPAEAFGVDRVRQTGDRLRRCSSAIRSGDREGALREAQAAAVRWSDAEK